MTSGIIMLILLLIFIFGGVPVAFALALSSLAVLLYDNIPLIIFAQRIAMGIDMFVLLAVPFYILAGTLMNRGGITRKIFKFAGDLVGHTDGGLGQVNILSSMIFAGMSGSAIADAAGLGTVEIKAMIDAGYDRDFSVAITAASSSVGPIIPPSIIMVIIGVCSDTSIGSLFIGGIIPGIIMSLSLMIITYFIAIRKKYPKNKKAQIKTIIWDFIDAIPALLMPLMIVVGILSGMFTATEAGCVAVVYALVLTMFVYKEIKFNDLLGIFVECMHTTAVLLMIVGTASLFGWIISYQGIPNLLTGMLLNFTRNPQLMLIMLVLLFIFLGCIMDAGPIVVMTLPTIMPLLAQLKIDKIHFGVILAMCMSIGTLTPPVGTVMYTICRIGKVSIGQYIKAIYPYGIVLLLVILLMIFFPDLVLFLPKLIN